MFFFFNDTATTEIYTLSLHDALPIYSVVPDDVAGGNDRLRERRQRRVETLEQRLKTRNEKHHQKNQHRHREEDRKSTRLNSSHGYISYAVFCLKKKKKKEKQNKRPM